MTLETRALLACASTISWGTAMDIRLCTQRLEPLQESAHTCFAAVARSIVVVMTRFAFLFVLVLLPSRVNAGVDRWTPVGPDGGAVTALAVDPTDAAHLYAATETAGVFRSSDGGQRWQQARTGLPVGMEVGLLAAGGADGRTLAAIVDPPSGFVLPQRLFVSTNGGDTWVERQPVPTPALDQAYAAVAVTPVAAPTVYVGAYGGAYGAPGGVFASHDGGLTWRDVLPVPAAQQQPSYLDLVIAPSDPNVLYALTQGDILSSGDGGAHWSAVGHVDPGTVRLAVDPRDPSLVYAAAMGTLARSSDAGHTWSSSSVSTLVGYFDGFAGLVIDPAHRGTIYYAVIHYVDTSGPFDARKYEGLLLRSTDAGRNWVREPITQILYALATVAVPGAADSHLYAGASRDGVLRSDDGGRSWQSATRGLQAIANCSLAADPFVPRLLYMSTGFCWDADNDTGFLRGIPGRGWTPINRHLRDPTSLFEAYGIVPDPHSPGTLYAYTGAGLFKSEDRGEHWGYIFVEGVAGVSSLVIDPLDSRRLYAIGYAGGGDCCDLSYFVLMTVDGGARWTLISPSTSYLGDVSIDPSNPDTLYVVGFSLIKSTDRGNTWTGIATPEGYPRQLLVDPEDSRVLYVALNYDNIGSIAKSSDGGETWLTAVTYDFNVESLAIDPTRPSTLYAGTIQGVFVSDDAGAHWVALSQGLGAQSVSQILVDPFDHLTLYAGTLSNGGLFSLTRSAPP
ncbi:MAG TPA: hypothetical protein VHB47_12850 [Thermoanaerobaculia bacterium]|nr:hypothetical protein [Thermoanaerobaculia bacterium]